MTALLARMQVAATRLGEGLRRHWKRVAAGAFCGWVASSVAGAFALVWLESQGVISSTDTTSVVAAALVWGGTALGGVVAYAMRQEPSTHS